ncbi:hypothetical protein OAN07_04530 [Candidatus Pelagibacter sp.]|nr:hypothetical protein [Candidatus Pelagibacter sp.]
MKNKIFYIIIIFFFKSINFTNAQEFTFEAKKIEINENVINAYDGQALSKDGDIIINGKIFEYNIDKKILKIKKNGLIFIKSKNTSIIFKESTIDETQQTIQLNGNVEIFEKNKQLKIKSDNLLYNIKLNLIKSDSKTIVESKNQNYFFAESLFYETKKDLLKVKDLTFEDKYSNKFSSNLAFINVNTNKVFGKDLFINLNSSEFSNNEPRLKGNSVVVDENYSILTKGIFTSCKRRDGCPPWQITAKKITHDKKKKIINYENALLRLYDKPILYFPKFFHPDPTVKRQSGFLTPSFSRSNNSSNYINLPYFYAISDNNDFTITPRFYSNNNFLVQSEFRQVNKYSYHILDFSYFNENRNKDGNHLFYSLSNFFNLSNFDKSKIDLKIQQTSSDTYLKKNKINSKIINDKNILENSVNINMYNPDLLVDIAATSYENLNRNGNDRYEFIMPSLNIIKNIKNNTKIKGNIIFETESLIRNYNTNVTEKLNINNLVFKSDPIISKFGFYNYYDFIIKNSNTNSKNSKNFKNDENNVVSSLVQLNSSLPLKKNSKNYESILKPKLSFKIAPEHTKNYKDDETTIDINNIYSLNRISKKDTLEGGISLAYGGDYSLLRNLDDHEIINFKFANNIRFKENEDLTNINQIGQKTSNFFTESILTPHENFTLRYQNSIKNNLSEINSEILVSEIKFKNFNTSFSYLNENYTSKDNTFILNETNYNFDDSNQFKFSTRINKKTDLTEFYKLIYLYKNDCLTASIEYNKDYYTDRELVPEKNIFFKLSLLPFGQTSSPNLLN